MSRDVDERVGSADWEDIHGLLLQSVPLTHVLRVLRAVQTRQSESAERNQSGASVELVDCNCSGGDRCDSVLVSTPSEESCVQSEGRRS